MQQDAFRGMLALLNLIEELNKELSAVEGLPDHYIRLIARIRRIFQINELNADFNATLNRISEGDLDLLEECEERLVRRKGREEVADQLTLEELMQDVTALYEQVMAAPLDRELKEFIGSQLESIRRAIHEYRLGGIERLRTALAVNLGELILNRDLIQKYKENELLKNAVTCTQKLGSIIAFGSDLTTLISNVAPHILRLSSGG
jgi:hypothetical protein